MLNFKLSQLAIATSLALTLSACGGSSSSDPETPVVTPPTAETFTATGAAVKGIMIGADVVAYDADGNEIASAVTDENGSYSLDIPSDFVGAIKVTVTTNADSIMRCDSSDCGNGVGFGEDITNTPGIALSTVAFIDEDTDTSAVEFPVNALTNATAQIMEASTDLADLNASGKAGFDALAKLSTKKVALVFGLTDIAPENFLTQDITDPTTISDLSAEDAAGLSLQDTKLSMLNALILQLAQDGAEDGADISAALAAMTSKILSATDENGSSTERDEIANNFEAAIIALSNDSLFQQEFALLNDTLGGTVTLPVSAEDFSSGDFAEELASDISDEVDGVSLNAINDAINSVVTIIETAEGSLTDEDIAAIEDEVDTVITPTPTDPVDP
ncbi:hypothetical protein KO509_04200, partial [Colwellia sp. C2M11]